MNYDEAKHCLLMHGCGTLDTAGQPDTSDNGFLSCLRPYEGLLEQNFHLVMEALLVAGERIHCSPQVDSDLVQSLWIMCSYARSWGIDPDGMLQRNRLITREDTKRLDSWVHTIESTAHSLLGGHPPHYQMERYAQYIVEVGWWDNIDCFIPLMEKSVSDEDLIDPSLVAAALGKIGTKARPALPTLYRALMREYSWYSPTERCTAEVREIIRKAIRNIENSE